MQHDWDARVRQAVLQSLKRLGDSSEWTLHACIEALGDRSPETAVEALGSFGSKAQSALPALRAAKQSRHDAVRVAAREALRLIDS